MTDSTRRTVLIAGASTGLTLTVGAGILLAPKLAPKRPLAERVQANITLRFDVLSAADPSKPASLQNQ